MNAYRLSRRVFFAPFIVLLAALSLNAQNFYWESPRFLTDAGSSFPAAAYSDSAGAAVWQEAVRNTQGEGGSVFLSARIYRGGIVEHLRFAGPFSYEAEIPQICSTAVNKAGTVAVAAADAGSIIVYMFAPGQNGFDQIQMPSGGSALVAPRIYTTASGGFILFASQGGSESFSLLYSASRDGKQWTAFRVFTAANNLTNPFLPFAFAHNGADIVLFQASYESGGRFTSQIFASRSVDGCATWSQAVMVTGAQSLAPNDQRGFGMYQNQRPMGFSYNNQMYMAWERRYVMSESDYVWVCGLDSNLRPLSPEQITDSGSAMLPRLFSYNGVLSLLWTDTSRGMSAAFLAEKAGMLWETSALSGRANAAIFASPLLIDGGKTLNIVWQSGSTENLLQTRVAELVPDTTVAFPIITPRSFADGKSSQAERVTARIAFPSDPSGIAGYSWIWTHDPAEDPPRVFMRPPSEAELSGIASEDGEWYFKAAALDYAGNWSDVASLRYRRDRTPPAEPKIMPLALDEAGCLPSNTFTVRWEPGDDDDISGYTWQLEYITPMPQRLYESPGHPLRLTDDEAFANLLGIYDSLITRKIKISPPPSRLAGTDAFTSFENRVNGIYAFSVAAVDEVGNIGQAAVTVFALNKYVPSTIITAVNAQYGGGILDVSIIGRGFTYDGIVTAVYFDRDGIAPFDYTFTSDAGMFRVNSDGVITGIRSAEIEEGNYRVGLKHSDRGVYWSTPNALPVVNSGTVKFGNFTYQFIPALKMLLSDMRKMALRAEYLVYVCVLVFAVLGLAVSLRGIANAAGDTLIVRREIRALMTGGVMPRIGKRKAAALLRRGVSLRLKLVTFTIFLVSMVVLLVSLPLSVMMQRSEERTLASGLLARVNVLLQSLSAQTRIYLPQENILDLSFVPEQGASLAESRYVLITGLASADSGIRSTYLDYVWATNDPAIGEKIDTESLTLGVSRNVSELVAEIAVECAALNERAIEAAGEMSRGITQLTAEALSLIQRNDPDAVERRREIQQITAQLNTRLASELNAISEDGEGSYPRYDPAKFDRNNTTYLFYRPVVFRQGSEQNYVRGIVFVEISTRDLIAAVDASRASIYAATLFIGLLAIGIGALGSFILATIIVNPIKRLARHVAMIRDTEDKEKLDGKDIVIRQKDEIGVLGDTVNDMTHGLIKAAAAAKDLTVGKDLQKMFIPLEMDTFGRKLTTGSVEDAYTHFFGYYEGAKGVSGDYFDYMPLDGRWYAIIKCDVAGKGVPASLIMVEVATLFLNFFQDWTYRKNGTDLSQIVARINDLIESRGFKGRFAAFTLCLFDSFSGECHFCNAGDSIVHLYDSAEGRKKNIALPESPASGVFPTFMVETKGGFPMFNLRLNKGDVLFLYTDGIEEAKRLFRDEQFNPIVCAAPGLKDDPHGNHSVGQSGEEMTPDRVTAIIEAVFARGVFTLEKWHNPAGEEKLVFDFSECAGTSEDVILALVSVEKIFRMYKPPNATAFDRVQVDRKIDSFLREHFKQYDVYCLNHEDFHDAPEYMYYTYVQEDPQYDDLTLVAIKRK
ncbi:MAG: SpoIIE family protein phosphatase [Treponemataceae bacterium]|nr:MAG: SpoIIE family protein phosphatase [Treponemataceae bacterium]